MKKELPKTYDPSSFEDRIYESWSKDGLFAPRGDASRNHYSIVIPPPNITGQLHMGHALDNTLQDILIRHKRMQGVPTLWLPGTDHASIATEAKIVEAMRKEGLAKADLGREKFLERAWAWKKQYGGRIVEQLKKMGSSCDWSRERFTLDEGCSRAVREVFVRLYEKGLIYRGERIINWCPHCRTSISNAEVNYEEQQSHFWHIRYPLVGGGGYLEVATTRPETLLGDTAVAVNPEDERYKHLIGSYCVLPLVGRRIPIVADEHAQLDKGTGCVKITPAHDPNDFEVGRRRRLPMEVCLTEDAKITANYPKYAGMDRFEARKAIVADLEAGGYLASIEDLTHEVGTCYRCGTTIEPMISLQWFVRMEPLAGPAIEAVRDGRIRFVPERFDKNYFHWMENTQDWCISRQLWWGHRIPAYYCEECGETTVAKDEVTRCPKCGGKVKQDEDTLDTWFSSALWPFSTMGWPDDTEDLKNFFPTNTLVTGYDIITFWVSRMIFSSLEYTGQVPFDTVLIHGLVRDAQGRKMSKSLGNGIDPLEIIDKYGADALRFALATGNSPGNDMRFSDEKIEAARNFANKLWNAARFVMMNLEIEKIELPDESKLAPEDKWILTGGDRQRQPLQLRDRHRPLGDLRLHLGRVLRLVYRAVQEVGRGRRQGEVPRRAERPRIRAPRDAEAASSVHAVHHRGDLLRPPGRRGQHHDKRLPGRRKDPVVPRRGGRYGARDRRDRRDQTAPRGDGRQAVPQDRSLHHDEVSARVRRDRRVLQAPRVRVLPRDRERSYRRGLRPHRDRQCDRLYPDGRPRRRRRGKGASARRTR